MLDGRLLTNNTDKVLQLQANGVDVLEIVPTGTYGTERNLDYLRTKKTLAGHWLDLESAQV